MIRFSRPGSFCLHMLITSSDYFHGFCAQGVSDLGARPAQESVVDGQRFSPVRLFEGDDVCWDG